MSVTIIGTGSALPARVVHNQAFEALLDTSDDWIVSRTGIHTRHFAGLGETSASLAIDAARRALEAASISPDKLDLIVCGTVSPERTTPSNASVVHAALGCRPIPVFDMSAACSGFLYALGVAEQFIRSGQVRYALIIGSEVLSRLLNYEDRTSCILFGDGAGAVVLANMPGSSKGLMYTSSAADGAFGDLIQVPGPQSCEQGLAVATESRLRFITVNGREAFRFAVRTMSRCIKDAVTTCGLSLDEIDVIVPHQVNMRVFEIVVAELGIALDKLVINIDQVGNTAAASVPIALDEAVRSGRIVCGDIVVLVAFGGGLTWSVAVMRWF